MSLIFHLFGDTEEESAGSGGGIKIGQEEPGRSLQKTGVEGQGAARGTVLICFIKLILPNHNVSHILQLLVNQGQKDVRLDDDHEEQNESPDDIANLHLGLLLVDQLGVEALHNVLILYVVGDILQRLGVFFDELSMGADVVMIEICHHSLLSEVEVNFLDFAIVVLPANEEVVEEVDFLIDWIVGLGVGGHLVDDVLGLHVVNRELDTGGVSVDLVLHFDFLSKVFSAVEEALAGFVHRELEVKTLNSLQRHYQQ